MVGNSETRIAVIGGGIAGVSAAFALVHHPARPAVTLLEAESQLAQHTTGRSAALLTENYGSAPVRALTAAGLSFLREPPSDYVDGPILHARSLMTVAGSDQGDTMDRLLAEGRVRQAGGRALVDQFGQGDRILVHPDPDAGESVDD